MLEEGARLCRCADFSDGQSCRVVPHPAPVVVCVLGLTGSDVDRIIAVVWFRSEWRPAIWEDRLGEIVEHI